MKFIIMLAGIFIMGVFWGYIIYCCYQMNKYRKLANIERKYIYEKYGIWIDEEPMM